jgi:glc operon protein GlcG
MESFKTTKSLTLDGARKMMAAAEAEAVKNNWNVAIAIVDAAGHLLMFAKRDDTQFGSIDVAIGKARTAAAFKRPTKAMEEMISGGRSVFLALDNLTPIQGGLPITLDGQVVGGVGVSGVMSSQDEQVAQAALEGLKK